jgi:hypothetical protein
MKERSGIVVVAVLALVATGGLLFVQSQPQSEGMSAGRAKGGAAATRVCASGHFTEREVDLIEAAALLEGRRQGLGPIGPAGTAIGTINVAFHVIYFDDGFTQTGLLTQTDVDNQIAALNAAFNNVDFVLAATTFTNNFDWFFMQQGSIEELQAKTALHFDNNEFLNIYSCSGGGENLIGWATFPWQLRRDPVNDGVVIAFDTVPGGTPPYDEGDTCVHEVGHWCGLYHTFQLGCIPLNDRVADTPAERTPNFGCPASRDTCPAAGLDPIDNFMDYSDDICMTNFTPGQEARMNRFLQLFRPTAIGFRPVDSQADATAPAERLRSAITDRARPEGPAASRAGSVRDRR